MKVPCTLESQQQYLSDNFPIFTILGNSCNKNRNHGKKRKQGLHGKYLKIRSKENKTDKTYETIEKIKKQAKKNYYRNKIKLFEKTCKTQGKS